MPDAVPESSAFPVRLLESLDLDATGIVEKSGWSNQVWLARDHVVRLSSGRFRDSFAHEARVLEMLPVEIPHAPVAAYGRLGQQEWLVLGRLPGVPLGEVWAELDGLERGRTARELGRILSALHRVVMPADLVNPWIEDALGPGGNRREAFHAPPRAYLILLEAASEVAGVDRRVLDEVGDFIGERLGAFPPEANALVHADIHFGNIIWHDGRISGLVDFESARPAPPDLELDTLMRFTSQPEAFDWPSMPVRLTRDDLAGFVESLGESYPALFAAPRLSDRLVVYDALWNLVQLLHFPPGSSGPFDPWRRLVEMLDSGRA